MQASQGNSLLHRADPGIKIVAAFALILVLALAQQMRTALAGMLAGILLLALARISSRVIGKRLLVINGFTLFLLLTLPLTYPGEALLCVGPLLLSRPGLQLGLLIAVKANAIFFIFLALAGTAQVESLGQALRRLGLPTRLCQLLLYSHRYFFVVRQEYERLFRAARMRAFQPANSLHTWRTYGYLLGMTVVGSWNRAQRVQQAMLLRGFDGRFHSLNASLPGRGDFLLLGLLLAGAGVLLALELQG